MTFVSELEPTPVFRQFDRILEIPRASGNEAAIREHVIQIAKARGLEARTDGAGNVYVSKPASEGCEAAPGVILQGHLDMVTEKNSDVEHDFAKDPIRPRRVDGYIKATGTTLGADNGIGIATMLAVLDATDLVHPPLQFLFTIDEESGLTGAANVRHEWLEGKRLVNLDSEEEGTLYVGCAGGGDTTLALALREAPVAGGETKAGEGGNGAAGGAALGAAALRLHLRGLRGGHSGVDIHLQRGNAIAILARCLDALRREGFAMRLASIQGGTRRNAIPREAFATVVVDAGRQDQAAAALRGELEAAAAEIRPVDPDLALDIEPADAPAKAWDEKTSAAIVRLLLALPHGVHAMSHDIEGLVETSTNLAMADVRDGTLVVGCNTRSSIDDALEAQRRRLRAIGELAGAEVEDAPSYPGWKPDLDASLLRVVREVHRRELGKDPEVKAIHAGLECGIIGKQVAGIEMVSFGPQIEFPHSPDEQLGIESVGGFYRLLTATLAELAGGKA